MASLELTNDQIVRAVLQILGAGRDAATNMDAALEADVRAIIRDGLRRFYLPVVGQFVYQWRWLEKHHAINIDVKYSTGTIAVSGGTITLTGGTWPSWLADGFIRVDGHVLFVTSRDGDTTLTTSNTALTVAALSTYEAWRYRYSLPSDFSEWLGGVVYADGSEVRQLVGSSEPEIRLRYAVGQGANNRTTHFAVAPTPEGTTFHILFWPVPQPDAHVSGTYLAMPQDNLPADLTTPGSTVQVAPIYAKAALEAILAEAENYMGKTNGEHEARFQAALTAAMAHDKTIGGAYDFSRQIQPNYRGGGPPPTEITFVQ